MLGSDSHHPQAASGGRSPGSHYTWVKMAQPSLEGLRLALIDGQGFSVRRSDEDESFDPFALPDHFIESVEIAGCAGGPRRRGHVAVHGRGGAVVGQEAA